MRTGQAVRPAVVGHDAAAGPVVFSPDGLVLVSGGADGNIVVWDGRTGALVGTVPTGRPDVATYPAFLADGHSLVVVASDGTVHSFDTDPRAWVAFACAVAGRELTTTEWADAVGDHVHESTCG